MIAPIRNTDEPPHKTATTTGLHRARRWVAKTMFDAPPAAKKQPSNSWQMLAATAWIVGIAAVYFGRMLYDLWNSR